MSDGPLANPAANARELALEKADRALMDADLDTLLRQPWGRRFFSRLVFQVGNLEALELDEKIKDGICAAIHAARMDGIRWTGKFWADEALRVSPEFWSLCHQERVARGAEYLRKQQEARNSQSENES